MFKKITVAALAAVSVLAADPVVKVPRSGIPKTCPSDTVFMSAFCYDSQCLQQNYHLSNDISELVVTNTVEQGKFLDNNTNLVATNHIELRKKASFTDPYNLVHKNCYDALKIEPSLFDGSTYTPIANGDYNGKLTVTHDANLIHKFTLAVTELAILDTKICTPQAPPNSHIADCYVRITYSQNEVAQTIFTIKFTGSIKLLTNAQQENINISLRQDTVNTESENAVQVGTVLQLYTNDSYTVKRIDTDKDFLLGQDIYAVFYIANLAQDKLLDMTLESCVLSKGLSGAADETNIPFDLTGQETQTSQFTLDGVTGPRDTFKFKFPAYYAAESLSLTCSAILKQQGTRRQLLTTFDENSQTQATVSFKVTDESDQQQQEESSNTLLIVLVSVATVAAGIIAGAAFYIVKSKKTALAQKQSQQKYDASNQLSIQTEV